MMRGKKHGVGEDLRVAGNTVFLPPQHVPTRRRRVGEDSGAHDTERERFMTPGTAAWVDVTFALAAMRA